MDTPVETKLNDGEASELSDLRPQMKFDGSSRVGDSRSNKIYQIALIVLVGAVVALFFHYMEGFCFDQDYPKNTFLFAPGAENDFNPIFNAVKGGNPYVNALFVYFPFTYFPLKLLTVFNTTFACLTFLSLFLLSVLGWVYSNLKFMERGPRCLLSVLLTLASYPVLFCFDRVNVECMLFPFLALFIIYFNKGKTKLSAFFLAAASAMKMYPGVFIFLFISRKNNKGVAWTFGYSFVMTLLALIVIPGNIVENVRKLQGNVVGFKHAYVNQYGGLHFNCSLFGLFRMGLVKFFGISSEKYAPFQKLSNASYAIFSIILFAYMAKFIVLREKALWKQVSLLTFTMLLFPYVSFDYKLIHLFLPLVLFISATEVNRLTGVYATLFGLLLIPKAYLWIDGFGLKDINIGVILNPLIMLSIAVLIILEGSVPAFREFANRTSIRL